MVSHEETDIVGESGDNCEPPQERGEEGWVGRCWGEMRGVRGSSCWGGGVTSFGSEVSWAKAGGAFESLVWRLWSGEGMGA